MKKLVIAVAFILLLLALRWGFLMEPAFAFFSSDDSVPLLMARHIAQGKSLPVFFYGQHYQGALSSYLYALIMAVIGFSARNLAIVNILLFASGSFLLARVVGPLRRTIWYFLLPLPALYFVSTETSRNFALVFFLTAVMISIIARSNRWKSWAGLCVFAFVAGLLFWAYQGSLVFSLPAGFVLLVGIIRGRKRVTIGFFAQLVPAVIAFLAGMLPLLISDLHNQFITLKFTFSSSATFPAIGDVAHWVWRFLTLGAYNQYMLKSASLQFPPVLILMVAAMTTGGYLLYLQHVWRTRKGLNLLLLPLMTVLMLSATRFGKLIAADTVWRSRYQVHSLILMPLALFFVVYGLYRLDGHIQARIRLKALKIPLVLILAVLVLMPFSLHLNSYAREGGRRMVLLSRRINRADVPELIFGSYTRVFRYNVLTRENRLMIPTPLPVFDNPVFAMIRYYPYALQATKIWESSCFGLLELPARGRWMHARLRQAMPHLAVRRLELPGYVLLIFPPRTPLRLLDRTTLQNAREWPPMPIPIACHQDAKEFQIRFAQTGKAIRYDRVQFVGKEASVSVPHVPREPIYQLPHGFPNLLTHKATLWFLGVQIPGKVELDSFANTTHPGTDVVFHRYSDPVDMVYFHQESREMRGSRGIILDEPMTVGVNSSEISRLDFRVTNPFTFGSDLWLQDRVKREQVVSIEPGGIQIRLVNGDQIFSMAVNSPAEFKFTSRYSGFFKVTDSGQATDIRPVGILIRKIEAVYRNGDILDVTPVVRNHFLEDHRRRVRSRAAARGKR